MDGVSSYHMPKTAFNVLLVLQLIATCERQIFDFLGLMWLPILANFLNIIFVIFGLFGAYQVSVRQTLSYTMWTLVWLAYNIFIICYYLNLGDLDDHEDILSFGAGSFSWWVINSPGCRPVYNTTLMDETRIPPRPSSVEDCTVSYETIEVTHAAIQIVLSSLGFILSLVMVHYFVTEVLPNREKQGTKSMYSIEYSPQYESNGNSLERETELQDGGDQRGHMTPRRVKRRSYRNSTRNSKSLNRQSNRQSGRSARSSGRSHKSINPVTRLIDADHQNRADSSTSNDAERYGQINPGYQAEHSRPNSIYNLSGPPTDIEASRPQSALTSYSNFHGQRRPLPNGTVQSQHVTNLTQESLLNHNQQIGGGQQPTGQQMAGAAGHPHNASFDDLPPPPPPLSSSPTQDLSDSDNTSSVATAQMPVPLVRSSLRRNEYVNIPLPPMNGGSSNNASGRQVPEPQAPSSTCSTPPPPPPLPRHNYANVPNSGGGDYNNSSSAGPTAAKPAGGQFNGARPKPGNPLYNSTTGDHNGGHYDSREQSMLYGEMDRTVGPVITYEAETLRADTRLHQPGLYNEPYYQLTGSPSVSTNGDQTTTEPSSPAEHMYGQRPLPQSPPGVSHQDTRFPLPPPTSSANQQSGFSSSSTNHQPGISGGNSYMYKAGPDSLESGPQSNSSSNDFSSHQSQQELLKRAPNGRDRVSLRARQRKDMEARASGRKQPNKLDNKGMAGYQGYVNTQPQGNGNQPQPQQQGYGHNVQNGYINGANNVAGNMMNGNARSHNNANGYADMSGGSKRPMVGVQPNSRGHPLGGREDDQAEDKWYLKDSMKPIGAAAHGATCTIPAYNVWL